MKKSLKKNIKLVIISLTILFLILFWLKFLGIIGYRYNIIYRNEVDNKNIDKINVLINAGTLFIKETDNENIKVVAYGQYSKDITVKEEENTLIIDYPTYANSYYNMGNYSMDVILYVNKNYSGEFNITGDEGNFEIGNYEKANLALKSDRSDIKISSINTLNIESNDGTYNINKVSNKVAIKCRYCDVNIESLNIKENSNIENDTGHIYINKTNDINIDAKSNRKLKINGDNDASDITLKINNKNGRVKVNY